MRPSELPASVVSRRAIVYVRQSSVTQVQDNLESQKLQYGLADQARQLGFRDVVTIDEDLGRSASGLVERPGFRSLVAQLCEGSVGAIFCLEASRLSRNGRDWHHLVELCGLVGARLVDSDGIYDPSSPNDRLLLGLKGTMSEFELTVLRRRLLEAALAKARRGELRLAVPIGYVWSADTGLDVTPDLRVQNAIRTVFQKFARLGSARQVLHEMRKEGLLFPRPADGKRLNQLTWLLPTYRSVLSVLQNPFYAGAYAYGKSNTLTRIVDGQPRKKRGRYRPMDSWSVLLRDHHHPYVTWEEFQKNQEQIAHNAHRKPAGGAKSGRGGTALLAGLLRCRRCGRMLFVAYGGRGVRRPRYTCRYGHNLNGTEPCISFGALRPDQVVAREILIAVAPLAVEAAVVAEQRVADRHEERRRALELEHQQASYEVRLAARRYEAIDPDNRLVAAELESRWNSALLRLQECERRLVEANILPAATPDPSVLQSLALNLENAWTSPSTPPRIRQQLVRMLIREIVVDVDDTSREVVLVIHWKGGLHSEHRVKKPRSGQHSRTASPDAHKLICEMATQWPDAEVAATLNRLGVRTGQGNTWTARRVQAYRGTTGIRGYESAIKDGNCLTMYEAAAALGVSSHVIRKLIGDKLLPARQLLADAPWQILASDLQRPEVQEALRNRTARKRPIPRQKQTAHPRTKTTQRSDVE